MEKGYEIRGLTIERKSEPQTELTVPECSGAYKKRPIKELLNDPKTTEFDTWCRHSD